MTTIVLALLACVPGSHLQEASPGARPEPIPIVQCLAIESTGERVRAAIRTDAMEALLARGEFVAPEPGASMEATTGEARTWTEAAADEKGWFSGAAFRGGWAFAEVEVPASGPWLLDARGHSLVLVDGEPRGGDPYDLGLVRTPLHLEAGPHILLFKCGRGRLRAQLEPAPAPVFLESRDRTLPDAIRGDEGELLLVGHIVSNASAEDARGCSVTTRLVSGGSPADPATSDLDTIPSSSQRKCAIGVRLPEVIEADELVYAVELWSGEPGDDARPIDGVELTLAVRDAHEEHARTFRSAIDGSIQYFAVTPRSTEPHDPDAAPALFLSLHGASVEARSQASSYEHKDWGVVVAPTNRRPFGFDWEDWGRLDALEVLAEAERRFGTDPRRTYLTGHSMGGHGTWQLGAHLPGRFAAIAPSAGWRDFWSYGGGGDYDADDPIGALLNRAANPSRTLLLERNYLHAGVYVLHGDADDNVPVGQARFMRERLAAFHPNFAYYERPGAGHWWGNRCMDWPPLFAFLEDNVLPAPEDVLEVDFRTVSPGISSRCHWVGVLAQERVLEPSRVTASIDPEQARVELEVENVARLSLDLSAFAAAEPPLFEGTGTLSIAVGDQILSAAGGDEGGLELALDVAGAWSVVTDAPAGHKGPARHGPFKDAFRNAMVFVYGTRGTPEENAWSFAKARYDHEVWRYRGNGAVLVVADDAFDPSQSPDGNVILYGNRDTNGAWYSVVGSDSLELRRGAVRVGSHELEGGDSALLAVVPRTGTNVGSVGIVGGTGLAGCRVTDLLPYFVSGCHFPDWTVLGPQALTEGIAGVRGAGFFANDWSVADGAASHWRTP